jgi:ABC-2 type transport system ATP-binding protein
MALAACTLHDPKLLLLDEPASGLDPRARAELRELIVELGRMGKIVIVSSHILPELAGFCNTVGIIERGTMLAVGPIEEITGSSATKRNLTVNLLTNGEEGRGWFAARPGVVSAKLLDNGEISIDFEGTMEQQADLLEAAVAANLRLTFFKQDAIDLEDVFFRVTTGAVN